MSDRLIQSVKHGFPRRPVLSGFSRRRDAKPPPSRRRRKPLNRKAQLRYRLLCGYRLRNVELGMVDNPVVGGNPNPNPARNRTFARCVPCGRPVVQLRLATINQAYHEVVIDVSPG